ncbi:translation initiation factor IF-5A [Candidatus Pacearchaeota archaeon]|nr:translation initiation factor IF-5A [Candidatus Pacearchaeota archaeon]
MTYKLIDATDIKSGTTIMVDGVACTVKSIDISKSGKHGASKCRIEAIGIIDDKKRVIAVPGHERFEVPLIEKRKAQVLSIMENKVSVMDSESFESFELSIPESLKSDIKEGVHVEYWNIEGKKVIKRVL